MARSCSPSTPVTTWNGTYPTGRIDTLTRKRSPVIQAPVAAAQPGFLQSPQRDGLHDLREQVAGDRWAAVPASNAGEVSALAARSSQQRQERETALAQARSAA